MSANDEIKNKTIRNQINIEKYKNFLIRKTSSILNKEDQKLRKKINSFTSDTFTAKRLKKINEWVDITNRRISKLLDVAIEKEFKSFIKEEFGIEKKILDSSLPVEIKKIGFSTNIPNVESTFRLIMTRPFQTKKFRQWFSDWDKQRKQITTNIVKLGFIEGKTISQMTRDLFGTFKTKFLDGALEPNRKQLKMIVRTSVNHINNNLKDNFYMNNSDIIKGVEWVATLDSLTSLICIALDGKVDLYDKSKQQLKGRVPPAHPNCRSTIVPILKSWRELGINKDELSESTRAAMDGQVSQKITYPAWLKTQSAEVQKKVLGATRYKLWAEGKVDVSQFTNNQNMILTVKQLRSA